MTHAIVQFVEGGTLEGHDFFQARPTEPIDPGPSRGWSSLMTITQPGATCTYPGTLVTWGHTMVGFQDTLVSECVGLNWALPVHVHIDGAITRAGMLPVPVVDADHTFGSDGLSPLVLTDPDATAEPACTSPACE